MMHLFHRWGKWEDGTATWVRPSGRTFNAEVQYKVCGRCNKKKIRKLS